MILEHIGLSQINGSLVVLDGVKGVQYDEMAELHLDDGSTRVGRVVEVEGDRCIIQVFEGTRGLSLVNNRTVLTGHPMMMDLSPELPGRVLDGLGRPIDGLGDIYPTARRDVNGAPINPVSRVYPRNYIHTGISSIDCLATLIRGQKLPIFSGSGMKHNELAVQIVRQASVADGSDFAIVFAAMGVKNDVAAYFRESFESCGAMERVVMLLNLANDQAVDALKDGTVDMIWGFASAKTPASYLESLYTTTDCRALPQDPEKIAAACSQSKDFFQSTIEGGTFPFQSEDYVNLASPAEQFASAAMSEEDAYTFVKTICENVDALATYYAPASCVNVEDALNGLPKDVPIHPGAAKYYQEVGVWSDDYQIGK